MKPTRTLIRTIRDAVITAINNYRDENLVRRFMGGELVSPEIYKTLLTNQLISAKQSNISPDMQLAVMTIARKIIDRILPISAIVGIQPMQAPCSIGFVMRQTELPSQHPPCRQQALEIKRVNLVACQRKFLTQSSAEAHQDLILAHGEEFANTFLSVVGDELATEIITEIVSKVFNEAGTTDACASYDPQHILLRINALANTISTKTHRGAGQVILTSAEGAALLHTLTGTTRFEPVQVTHASSYPACIFEVGRVVSGDKLQYRVFVTTVLPPNADGTIPFLVAYKGDLGEVDAGILYSPYVLAIPAGTSIDPCTFTPRMTFSTRYCIGADDDSMNYYATLKVSPPVLPPENA